MAQNEKALVGVGNSFFGRDICVRLSLSRDVSCVPLHDSDLASGDRTHGTGDLSLAVETGTPFLFCLWGEEDRDGIY
jgi:hypothetical protein